MHPGLRRLIYGFLIAVLLAVVFSLANDLHAAEQKPKPQSDGDVVVLPPSWAFCATLEPYGWWWFFWGCNEL